MKTKNLITILLLVIFFTAPVFAQNRVIDNANLLSASDKTRLEQMIERIVSAYKFELIILTEKSIGRTDATDYSWNWLDQRGLDGRSWDGCILLQSVEGSVGERDYNITASNRGKKILNNAAFDRLEKDVLQYLKQENYLRVYETFINVWEEFLILESKGRNYNYLHDLKTNAICLGIFWFIALCISFFVLSAMKAKMNTALPQVRADTYVIPGSLVFTKQSDRFLYSTVVKTKNESSSSSGGSSRSGGGRSSRSGKY